MSLALAACGSSSSDDKAAEPTTRTVQTTKGAVTVPAHPVRVIAGTAWAVDTLMDLGITPVGAFNGAANVVEPKYRAAMAKVPNISASDGYSDDLEKIAALKPDLIITFASSPTYAKESAIAPTIGQDATKDGWEQLSAQVADAVNRSTDLASLKKTYEQDLASLKSTYGKVIAAHRWYVVQPGDGGNPATLYAPANTEIGKLITQLGGRFGKAEAGTHYGDNNTVGKGISAEDLSKLSDGDFIFVWDNGDQPSEQATKLFNQALWKQLPAVRAGHVTRTSMPASYGQVTSFLDVLASACKKLGTP